ncbi:MAG: hypothetical protein GKR96_12905 [Gammaproteobacteria bacterium]|nr:hypothetical protein [Gammaproteobacteria bacterium]
MLTQSLTNVALASDGRSDVARVTTVNRIMNIDVGGGVNHNLKHGKAFCIGTTS